MSTLTGAQLRAARRKAGLTQRELADRLNVTQGAINHWESGTRRIKPGNAIALNQALSEQPKADPGQPVVSAIIAGAIQGAVAAVLRHSSTRPDPTLQGAEVAA